MDLERDGFKGFLNRVYARKTRLGKFGLIAMQFRHSAGFGKRIEYWVIGQMLKEGLDVYVPLVDDNGIDAIIRKADGSFVEVQIKARSREINLGDGGLFSAIVHEYRKNYWFVFYSERLGATFILSSREFLKESVQNKTGKNKGSRSIWFNGMKRNKETGRSEEYIKDRYQKYIATDFSRIINESPDPLPSIPHQASLESSEQVLETGLEVAPISR